MRTSQLGATRPDNSVTVRFVRQLELEHHEGGHDAGSMNCCLPCIAYRRDHAPVQVAR